MHKIPHPVTCQRQRHVQSASHNQASSTEDSLTLSTSAPIETVIDWLMLRHEVEPVPPEWVPGASESERLRLAALGSLVNSLVGGADADSRSAFAAPKLQTWLSERLSPPEEVLLAAEQVLIDDKTDWLAQIYGRIVSGPSRRTLGTFFTPPSEVDWMISRWADSQGSPAAVVDVGAGVGIFTTAAARRWPAAQVWSVDVNPITLGLLALRVHRSFPLRGSDENGPGLRLVLDDFAAWMEHAWTGLPEGRLILGNPPYTRLQLLPREHRDRLWKAAAGLCGRRASLSAIMTALSVKALGSRDGLCFLLPAQWLESDYAVGLRDYVWSLKRRPVELHLFKEELFNDAQVDAVALMIGTEQPTEQPILFSRPGWSKSLSRGNYPPTQWRREFEASKPTAISIPHLQTRLGDLLSARRGVATGANEFFVIPETSRLASGIAKSALRPLVRRLNGLPDVVTEDVLASQPDEEHYWLLAITPTHKEELKELNQYISHGENLGLHQRHLCKARRTWYDLTTEVFYPNLLMGPTTKKVFRFVENEAGATLVNNLYGLRWKENVPEATKSELLTWLRSEEGQTAIRGHARTQGAGLLKIEPRALERVPIPDRFMLQGETLI